MPPVICNPSTTDFRKNLLHPPPEAYTSVSVSLA